MSKQLINKEDLTLTENLALSEKQLNFIFAKTPARFIKQRPAKGGGVWNYVDVGYIIKSLNLMFGWNWDFEVLDQIVNIEAREIIVKGKLTVRTPSGEIVKTQFGNKDIIFRKDSKIPLSLGNDLKAAASDALKKCASLLGMAQDIYLGEMTKEFEIVTEEPKMDIAAAMVGCITKEDLQIVWESLTGREQETYVHLFEVYKKSLK